MALKRIGGYCQIRSALVKRLENLQEDEQYELKGRERICIYQCNGYDYNCELYRGEDINLKPDKK